jgi:uncharacterized OB-fold protein
VSGEFPLPNADWEPTRGFWQAAQHEELRVPRCEGCGELNWYPPPCCRYCECETLDWSQVSGRATLFSWSHVTRALFKAYSSKAPYTTGLVALIEDPRVRLVTLLVDCEHEALRIDMPVEVVFRPLEFPEVKGRVIAPMFRPV